MLALGVSLVSAGAVGGFDADAAAYFTAAGITDATQKAAVNTFILGLKSNSLWDSFIGLYPFVGGTSSAHAVNAKSPGTYNMTWVNSPTHNSNGVTGNGSTTYGDPSVACAVACPQNNMHVSVYCRTATPTANTRLWGAYSSSGGARRLDIYTNAGVASALGINDDMFLIAGVLDLAGFLMASRTGASARYFQRNATQASDSTASVGSPLVNLIFMARRFDASTFNHTNANVSFASFGTSFSTAQGLVLNTLVSALQTALSRNV